MSTHSQMLCRFEKPSPQTTRTLGSLNFLSVCAAAMMSLCGSVCATSASQSPLAASPSQPEIKPIASEEMKLLQTGRSWIAERTGVAFDEIQMATMDERLKVEPCEIQVQFDQPFANRHVIRTRCERPRWQYFLQASWPERLEPQRGTSQAAGMHLNSVNPTGNSNPTSTHKDGAVVSAVYAPPAKPTINGEVVRSVLVLNQPLKKGSILTSTHFKTISINVPQSDGLILTRTQEIENFELLHDMGSEQIIHSFDVKPSVMVKRGQEVTLVFGQGRGFTITVKTEALQDGVMGEQVRLKNVESGRIISGVVTGFSEAKGL